MATLLEQARLVATKRTRNNVNDNFDETLDLALAYARGEVSGPQAQTVMGNVSKQAIHHRMMGILFAAAKRGLLIRPRRDA